MNEMELNKRNYFARVGLLMAIVSLAFLCYMGSSLVHSAKRYHQSTQCFTNDLCQLPDSNIVTVY